MPLILVVADNGNGTGATATVSGSAVGSSNSIMVAPLKTQVFNSYGPLTGDGSLAIPIANGSYAAYVENTNSGVVTDSGVETFQTTGGPTDSHKLSDKSKQAAQDKKIKGWIDDAMRKAVEQSRRYTDQKLQLGNQTRAAKL